MIKLNKPVLFSDTVHAIRLSFDKSLVPRSLTLTRWNSSDPYKLPVLKEDLIPTLSAIQCSQKTSITFEDKIVTGTFYANKIPRKFCGGYNGAE